VNEIIDRRRKAMIKCLIFKMDYEQTYDFAS